MIKKGPQTFTSTTPKIAKTQIFSLTEKSFELIDDRLEFRTAGELEAMQLKALLDFLVIENLLQIEKKEKPPVYTVVVNNNAFASIARYFHSNGNQINFTPLRAVFSWLDSDIIHFKSSDIVLNQLHLLTGMAPRYSSKSKNVVGDKIISGFHLRYVFSSNSQRDHFKPRLDQFDITYCDTLQSGRSPQFYLTIDPSEFDKISRHFYQTFGWLAALFHQQAKVFLPQYQSRTTVNSETLEKTLPGEMTSLKLSHS